MDDTDTSHLQSPPDATLPASSLANDLKIPLTYSKKERKKEEGLSGEPPASNTGDRVSLRSTRAVRPEVRDMCLTLGPNCSPQSGDDN
ncbi:hypothetical protein EYF80_065555 [Liparis tanakae]|uniref:Uncharacterized protein n=1 Tax=Liparis tanakae TaxID=230148 RepID=A0A4Z2E7P4_9TELE|nr:hypothetical protein EYF80_065555 [Liparis tanakae]